MKTKLLLSLFVSFYFCLLSSQIPVGFNYQAIARDASGNALTNLSLPVRITIQSDSLGGTTFWIEEHTYVTTNNFGLFSIIVGKGLKKTGSTVNTFNDIDWKVTPKYIKTEINYSGWKNMGSSRLWSVPYSSTSGSLVGTQKVLAIKGETTVMDSALFQVKNNTGQTIFAVYNEGVRIYVDNGIAKGSTKGGFAIGGFGSAKSPSQEFFRVTQDSTRVYVKQPVKGGTKGGFAIGGFDGAKAYTGNFLNLTKENYFIGHNSGSKNGIGVYNSFMGYEAGKENTDGASNVFIGYKAGTLNTTGSNNMFIGNSSGYSNLVGTDNIFMGGNSGYSNTGGVQGWMGSNNIFLGSGAGYSNTEGGSNIFIGTNAGMANTDGNLNIYIGDRSGIVSKGVRNLFMGAYTGEANSSGTDNIFIGNQTGEYNTIGQGNTFLGGIAGWYNTAGNYNTYLGYTSGDNIVSGNMNVFVGYASGAGITSGDRNTFLGYNAGGSTSNSGNVFVGYSAGRNETNSNRLYIDNSAADKDHALFYGEFDNDIIKLNAAVTVRDFLNIKPRASAPSSPVEGDIYFNSSDHTLYVWNGSTWKACW